MPNVFEALAPRGPIKTGDDKWDVFLSYRSVDRPWALSLYDQLRHLDYEVFMDLFVLTLSGGLNPQLEENLERSATAVLIWSSRSEESQWCREDYDALRMQEKGKPGFRYIVLRVDETELPLFAQARLWIDFSSQPDGPTGPGLLRLLHGLHGKPLSDKAVRLAVAYEEAVQYALAKIGAARANGDPDTLLELVKSDAPEWTTTAMLPCKVAEALIAMNRAADAVRLLEALTERAVRRAKEAAEEAARQAPARADAEVKLRQLVDGRSRSSESRCYVSYAWADDSDPNRAEKVDELCEEAAKLGLNVVRDKTTLVHGDLISEFMRRIGEGDRIFIFLSDKYLRSPYCMFELFEMWRNSRQNKTDFLRRVRFFTIDDAKIGTPREWLAHTKFWRQERDDLKKEIDEVGWQDAGDEVIKRYRHMETFAGKVSDILALFADVVQPRTFGDFLKYGFDDPPEASHSVARLKPQAE
jgi:TIR domain-containing protein